MHQLFYKCSLVLTEMLEGLFCLIVIEQCNLWRIEYLTMLRRRIFCITDYGDNVFITNHSIYMVAVFMSPIGGCIN